MSSEKLHELFSSLLKGVEDYRRESHMSYTSLAYRLSDLSEEIVDERTLHRFLKGENLDRFCYRLSLLLACAEMQGVSLGLDDGLEAIQKVERIEKILS